MKTYDTEGGENEMEPKECSPLPHSDVHDWADVCVVHPMEKDGVLWAPQTKTLEAPQGMGEKEKGNEEGYEKASLSKDIEEEKDIRKEEVIGDCIALDKKAAKEKLKKEGKQNGKGKDKGKTRGKDLGRKYSGDNSACYGCGQSFGAWPFRTKRFCHFKKQYYCKKCHNNDLRVLPALLLAEEGHMHIGRLIFSQSLISYKSESVFPPLVINDLFA